MTLRMGRNDRVFPDYALFANDRRGEESARFIWEAKYRIANERQLKMPSCRQSLMLCVWGVMALAWLRLKGYGFQLGKMTLSGSD